jgi:membrane-associated protease RseP (regulator of RpoE activity)
MQFLRRNYVPLLLGIGATLLVAAVVAGVADLVTDEEPERRVSVGAVQFDLDQLEDALRDFDFDDLHDLEGLRDLPEIGILLELLRGYLSGFDGFGGFGEGLFGGGASIFATDQPTLGVTIDTASGALVIEQVQAGTAAANAGLRSGDEILSVDGRAVDEIDALRDAIADGALGRVYVLEVLRDGERQQFDVQPQAFVGAGFGPLFEQLGEQFCDQFGSELERAVPGGVLPGGPLPEGRTPRDGAPSQAPQFTPRAIPSGAPQLGISGVDAEGGVRVAHVQPGSGADVAGVRAGDLITGVEGVSTWNIQELRDRLGSFAAGDSVRVIVARDGRSEELRVRLSQPLLQSEAVPALGGLLDEASATGATASRALDQLAALVAARLAARDAVTDAAPTSIVAPAELDTFFGRVEAIDDDSIRLAGSLGGVTLTLTAQTVTIGSTQTAVGDLVTVVVRDRVVQLLIVVG